MYLWSEKWKVGKRLLGMALIYLTLNIFMSYIIGFALVFEEKGLDGIEELNQYVNLPGLLNLLVGNKEIPLLYQIHNSLFHWKLQLLFLLIVLISGMWKMIYEKYIKWGLFRKADASKYGSHGTARWASNREIKRLYMQDPNGFLLGQKRINGKKKPVIHAIADRLNQNIMTFGSSGSGKTSGYVIPNILYTAQHLGHSLVLTDPKGELYNLTSARLRELGYDIWVFNLLTGEHNCNLKKSMRYNPLDYVYTTEQAMQLANTIVANTDREKNADPFWENAERAYLSALILYVKEVCPKEEQHLRSIYNLGVIAAGNKKVINTCFERLPDHSEAKTLFEVFRSTKSDNTRYSIIMELASRLQFWASNGISHLTSASDFDLRQLGEKRVALFIMLPDYDNTFNLLPSLLIGQAFQELYALAGANNNLRLKVPVRFLIDEMANIAPIYNLDQKITTMRSRGISLVAIFQDLDQLEKGYEKWRTILSSCDTICFLGSNEYRTLEYFSEKLGETTWMIQSKGSDNSDLSRKKGVQHVSFTNRRLMTPDELHRLSRDHLIVFQAGRYPMMLEKMYYFQIKEWKNIPKVNWIYEIKEREDQELIMFQPIKVLEKKRMEIS